MQKHLYFGVAAAALFFFPIRGLAFQQDQSQQSRPQAAAQQSDSQAKSSAQTSQPAPEQKESLAAAARRAREEKKEQPKPAKVFTNDNVPTSGGISSVGETPAAPAGGDAAGGTPAASSADQEKVWREKFSKLRHKVEQDQQELDVMQRELGVLDVQYYNNPVKAMQQELTRSDINKKTSDIDAKKAQVEADKQAISDAEDDLRKAGGDPGWAR
jgi:hypothetical protein